MPPAAAAAPVAPVRPAMFTPRHMRTDDLDYTLPDDLIATRPAAKREDARLLVVRRDDPTNIQHRAIRDLPEFISPRDAVTLNNSSVLPARLRARRADTGGKVEGLYLSSDADRWRVLLKSNSKLRPGQRLDLLDDAGNTRAALELLEKHDAGEWTVRVQSDSSTHETLAALGAVPLPPYILQARKTRNEIYDPSADAERYQTVYADPDRAASVAAPTAGLHLTPELLDALRTRGASINTVTLHVGAGTFKPIETDALEDHPMHSERIEVPAETLRAIKNARDTNASSLAVGTTTARALESVPENHSETWSGDTRLLIAPGYEWKRTDALLTNFHLPRSTLLAMVAALFPQGVADLLNIYETAIKERYRFYSYGDAMLIL